MYTDLDVDLRSGSTSDPYLCSKAAFSRFRDSSSDLTPVMEACVCDRVVFTEKVTYLTVVFTEKV